MSAAVGFIGLGNMGNPMALNVLQKGFPLTVFDTRPSATANLVEAGAKRAASLDELVGCAEIVMTCLPGAPEVEDVYLGTGGVIERAGAGTVLVDLSSVLPSTPRKIELAARARDLAFLEAPVSGGVAGARAATLAIMAGGDAAVLARVRPALEALGSNIFHVGTTGAGNTLKAINNMMANVNSCAMMEGLALGLKAGLEMKTMAEVIGKSSGASKSLSRIADALAPRNFEPGFKVALMNKDLDTFNAVAKELHVPVSLSHVAQRYQQAALAAGFAEKDSTIVFTIIEQLAGLPPAKRA